MIALKNAAAIFAETGALGSDRYIAMLRFDKIEMMGWGAVSEDVERKNDHQKMT